MNKNLLIIKEKVREAVPEIMELKFGCEVLISGAGEHIVCDITEMDNVWCIKLDRIRGDVKGIWLARKLLINKPNEILGRPITIEDVFKTINKKYNGDEYATLASNGWIHFGRERAYWDFSKSLDNQSKETLSFFAGLLTNK